MKTYKSFDDLFADGLALCGTDIVRNTVIINIKHQSKEVSAKLVGYLHDAMVDGVRIKTVESKMWFE